MWKSYFITFVVRETGAILSSWMIMVKISAIMCFMPKRKFLLMVKKYIRSAYKFMSNFLLPNYR